MSTVYGKWSSYACFMYELSILSFACWLVYRFQIRNTNDVLSTLLIIKHNHLSLVIYKALSQNYISLSTYSKFWSVDCNEHQCHQLFRFFFIKTEIIFIEDTFVSVHGHIVKFPVMDKNVPWITADADNQNDVIVYTETTNKLILYILASKTTSSAIPPFYKHYHHNIINSFIDPQEAKHRLMLHRITHTSIYRLIGL